ncbi:MAG: hypothetical protein JKY43_09905 [Phycisphaerales bacterium]|nr:hypothetical protein [Phycisphaerales bacterium]
MEINHSCRSATIGSRFAARIAGYIPNTIPTPILVTTDSSTLHSVTIVGVPANCVISDTKRG